MSSHINACLFALTYVRAHHILLNALCGGKLSQAFRARGTRRCTSRSSRLWSATRGCCSCTCSTTTQPPSKTPSTAPTLYRSAPLARVFSQGRLDIYHKFDDLVSPWVSSYHLGRLHASLQFPVFSTHISYDMVCISLGKGIFFLWKICQTKVLQLYHNLTECAALLCAAEMRNVRLQRVTTACSYSPG